MGAGNGLLGVVPRLLELLRDGSPPQQALYWLLAVMSEHAGCESSGLRWKSNGDYPYYVTRGFSQRHLLREGSLQDRDAAGEILRHRDGAARLACLCGVVITQQGDPRLTCFTEGGSFWTNSLSGLLEEKGLEKTEIALRGECHRERYESVALIPLRSEMATCGLIQLNSRSEGRFTTKQLSLYEGLGRDIAAIAAERVADMPDR